jgi:hypothetical protein
MLLKPGDSIKIHILKFCEKCYCVSSAIQAGKIHRGHFLDIVLPFPCADLLSVFVNAV